MTDTIHVPHEFPLCHDYQRNSAICYDTSPPTRRAPLCIVGIHRHHKMAARTIPTRICGRHGYDCNHTVQEYTAIIHTCKDCGYEWEGLRTR